MLKPIDATELPDPNELAYMIGRRAAYVSMLRTCLRELGYDDAEAGKVAWIAEREEAVSTLRRVCEEFGDNDWPDSLHLGDVIEKHLERYLERIE